MPGIVLIPGVGRLFSCQILVSGVKKEPRIRTCPYIGTMPGSYSRYCSVRIPGVDLFVLIPVVDHLFHNRPP